MNNYGTSEVYAGVYLAGPPKQSTFRSLENPNLPLNDPDIWDEVFGDSINSDSGLKVNEDTALMYAPVWQAVTMIASSVAILPFHHYRYRPDISPAATERIENSPLDYLVSVSPDGVNMEPNDYSTATQFWESFMVDALLWNNAFAYIVYDRAMRARQLRLLNPDRTSCERHNGKLWYVTEYTDEHGERKVKALYPWEVLHVRGLSSTMNQAPRFIRYARNSIGLGLSQQKFMSKFFANGGRVGGILELPAGMPKPVRDQVEEGFRKTYEDSDVAFKTVILRDSAKFHAAQQSPVDSQMVEAGEAEVRMVARWFNMSPGLLGLSGSVSYSSKEQDNQAYLDNTLKRWLRKIQAECALKLLPTNKIGSEFFKHDVSDLVSMDSYKQAQTFQIYRQTKVMNGNEIRGQLGMLPVPGLDEFENPFTDSGKDDNANDTDNVKGNSDSQSVKPDDVESPKKSEEKQTAIDSKEARVLFNLTHVARQKSKNRRAFMEWVDGGWRSQGDEWVTLTGRAELPQSIESTIAALREMTLTVTDDALVSTVDSITTTIEEGFSNGTQIHTT